MKKYFVTLVALLVAVAIAAPVFAAVDFKYGGQFRARWISEDNISTADDDLDDNRNLIDQRLRLYFTFQASENLKLVTKLEMGDTVWGQFGQGGRVGADERIIELKNAYIDFNIPNTMLKAMVGIQGIVLLDSWIVDDDFSAAVVQGKFDPVKVTAGYIAGQNSNVTDESENIDDFFLAVDYVNGPLAASLIGFYQYGHDTPVSANPFFLSTPAPGVIPAAENVEDNNLFDLGLNVTYKLDFLKAYVNFVKNFGSVDIDDESVDYTGWMVDAGATYFCGPYTFNLGGFYTSGDDDQDDDDDEINFFTYPLATSKYFSEIVGGGILDRTGPLSIDENEEGQWRGYGFPTNLWTVTVGGAWQVLDKTKLSASYWYFGTSEDVISHAGSDDTANDVGHELDFYLTQGVVDGLTLDLVAAYMFAGDAYSSVSEDDDNVYELGARLQWNF